MELKLPENKTALPSEIAFTCDYGKASLDALRLAFESVDYSKVFVLTSGMQGLADKINRYHDLVRREYAWSMADALIENGGVVDRFVMPCDTRYAFTANGKRYTVPFHYFGAPLYVNEAGQLARDPNPVYYNLCADAQTDRSEIMRVQKEFEHLLQPKKQRSITKAKDRPVGVPLLLALLPAILAIALCVLLWAFRFGSADVNAAEAALHAAMAASGVSGMLAGAAIKVIPFIRGAIYYTTIDNSPDLEIVGPILMWIFLIVVLGAGLLATGWLMSLHRDGKDQRNRNRWKKEKEAEAQSRKDAAADLHYNKTRFKKADQYRRSSEYRNAFAEYRQNAEEVRRLSACFETWHRAWFEAVSASWNPADVAIRVSDAKKEE